MKTFTTILVLLTAALAAPHAQATVLTAIPGPDDQGGMIMPMITLSGTSLGTMFTPPATLPKLQSLETWSPGDTFAPTAAWFSSLDPVGGSGDLFNSRYGFMFNGAGDLPPVGSSVGIRLNSASADLQFWNYSSSNNRFDEVFPNVGSQVLWNGTMWHSVVTMPSGTTPGTYSASFEFFIADTEFSSGTGFVDYSASALAAGNEAGYAPITVNLSWDVVPEPTTVGLLGLGLAGLTFFSRRQQRRASH